MRISRSSEVMRQMSKAKKTLNRQLPEKQANPVLADKNGNILLQILAKPGAKANRITGIEEEGIGVQINARPVEGEANEELINYMAKIFGLKKSEISFEKGMKSRQKVLLISKKDLTSEKVMEKLREEMRE